MISEAKGYGYKNRQPAGRSLVEGRNDKSKLTIWAQDLKPETLYGVFLLFADDKRYAGVSLGSLPIDERGKGEIRKEFGGDILGDFALQDVLAVVVIAKDIHGVAGALCGYRDSPVSWRHGFYEYIVSAPEADKVPETPQNPEASQDLPPAALIAEDLPPESENMPLPNLNENNPEQAENPALTEIAPEELLPPGDISQTELPDPEPAHDQINPSDCKVPSLQEEIPGTKPSEDNYVIPPPNAPLPNPIDDETIWSLPKNEMARAFRTALDKLHAETIERSVLCEPASDILSLFQTKELITPFQKQARKADWVSFTLSDPVPPPVNKPNLFDDPFVQSALAEYHHLILGITTDQGPKRYIIGVPGIYTQESKHKAKRLGFTQFKCTRDALPSWGEAGYWLMFTTVC